MTEPEIKSEFFEPATQHDSALLDRPRLSRPPLIPKWVPVVAAVAVGVIAVLVVGLLYANSVSRVSVPKLVGLKLGVANSRAATQRLKIVVAERRFSVLPADTIIEQSPAAGTSARRGDSVSVVVSAGTEEFAMPDVVGNGLLLARGVLEGKGLELRVETEPSQQASGTVLATNPSPGVMVRTGAIVRVTVASQGTSDSALLPLNMQGVAVTIDPGVVPKGQTDVTLEVSRRLRSLIEASGGTVLATRSLTDTGAAASEPTRARRAQVGSANVAVGLAVVASGPSGTTALYPLTGPAAIVEPSRTLATGIATSLVSNGLTASASTVATDVVLTATKAPWSRVRLGSLSSAEDMTNFKDPKWADGVARSIYRAIAQIYGVKGAAH
jgi:N-acetylmuramoyl-L-alanine amidase